MDPGISVRRGSRAIHRHITAIGSNILILPFQAAAGREATVA
jgi:hypothetical protein